MPENDRDDAWKADLSLSRSLPLDRPYVLDCVAVVKGAVHHASWRYDEQQATDSVNQRMEKVVEATTKIAAVY